MDYNIDDLKAVINNKILMNEIINEILDDPEVRDNLVSDLASEISDNWENNTLFENKLSSAVMKDENFRKIMIKQLMEDLS